MGWILESHDGESLNVNAWNWRPTLALLEQFHVLDGDTLESLGYNIAVEVTAEQAARIAAFLEDHLTSVPAAGRVLLDGSVTTEPDTFEFYRDDLARNYSATADWLARFRDFCRDAKQGFTAS